MAAGIYRCDDRAVADLLVLCYHGISEQWPAAMSVTPEGLESQLRLLVSRGYRGATFLDAVSERPSRKTVVVTFDDALRSVLELGLPILARLGLPATVFVPTDFPSTPDRAMSWEGIEGWLGGEHEDELRPMSWDELRGLAELGWELGSHTRSHPHLTSLPDRELAEELQGSREELQECLGRPCRTLAYPYGDHDDRVAAAAGSAGYIAGATLPARFPRPRPLYWPRLGIYRLDDMRRYRVKVSRAVRLVRATPLWPEGGGQET
jgi:peptidoglycan/xylan/chitin deacetylase (PgdA/CDA1 family)